MTSRIPILLSGLLAAAGLTITAPSPAQGAVPWAIVPTGTTDLITAVDYKGDTIAFGTVAGEVYVGSAADGFAPMLNVPGAMFRDVSLSPDGTKGVALAGNDAYVYDGTTWTAADWTDVTFDLAAPGATYPNGYCPSSPGAPGTYPPATLDPTTDLVDVEWLDGSTALISVDGVDSSVLETIDGGATWAEAARDSAGNCLLKDKQGSDLTVTGSTIWIMNRSAILRSVDGFATVQPYGIGADHDTLAVDPANPTRQLQATAEAHYSHLALTTDGWGDYDWIRSSDATQKINDVVAAPGMFYAAGTGGLVERIGASGLAQKITVPGRASTEWKAAAVDSAGRLVLAGAGGSLALSTNPKASLGGGSGGGGGGGTSTLPPSGNPPVAGGSAAVKAGKVTFKLRGKLALPAGTSKKAGCKGKIKVTVKASPSKRKAVKTVKRTKVKVKKNCTYVKQVKIPRAKVGKAKKLRLILKFTGNKVVGRSTARYAIRIRH